MRRNVPNQRAEGRTVQQNVQILLTVCGIVFLALGLILAVSGTSVNSAIGSVTDELGGSDAPDAGTNASDDSDASTDGNETEVDDEPDGAGEANGSDGTGGDGDDATGSDSDDTDNTDDGDSDNTDDADDGTDTDDDGSGSDTNDGGSGSNADDDDSGTDADGGSETHTLTTTVEDDNGNSIDNATVTVAPESGSNETRNVNGTGEVAFDLEDGAYTVSASASGYEDAATDVQIDGDDESVTLVLEAQSTDGGSDGGSGGNETDANDGDGMNTLTVTVEDGSGGTIDNATVTVTEADGLFRSSEDKDVNGTGEATFDLEDGSYTVAAEADGYDGAETDIEIDGDDKSVTLVLEED